jgi:L-threonylcarbamoyladenylate synthase
MKTLRLRLSSANVAGDPALLEAARILRAGGLVAFPTETVYGLGANATDAAAVEQIFAAKERPHWDPVIVHVAEVAEARGLVREWPEAAERLAAAFWPGPLTMLLRRAEAIPAICTAGREKVGLRLPSHPVARALIAAAGVPVAAPSANRFGHTSPTTAEHVLADLDGRIDAVLDGGACALGVESTVLDPMATPPMIYRPGGVTAEQIERLLGGVQVAERNLSPDLSNVPPEALESPGLGIRHYAPRARVLLVESEGELAAELSRVREGVKIGVLLPGGWTLPAFPHLPTKGRYGASSALVVCSWGSWSEPETLARELYAQLRALDESGVDLIICPVPSAEGIGLAIRDRLRKAAK